MEHKPWICQEGFDEGINGQRIAIMGYSHHHDEADHERMTIDAIEKVRRGDDMSAFFTHIAGYFGFDDLSEFWRRVLFFNFLPKIIGKGDDRFKIGGANEHQAGRERVERIIRDYKPHKLFVFTEKGWKELPDWEARAPRADRFAIDGADVCQVVIEGHTTIAVGLRHPQGAIKSAMITAVAAGMALSPISNED